MAAKNSSFKIILGSSSMARRQILAEMGHKFEIVTADIDEKSIRREKPEELVMALAEAKVPERENGTGQRYCFQSVFFRNNVIDMAEAQISFLKVWRAGGSEKSPEWQGTDGASWYSKQKGTDSSLYQISGKMVYFHDIPDEVIDSLVEEGVMLNVAGGLMLEHPLTLPFVDTVVGTVDCVMGLPKTLTEKLIQEAL
ncbi:hypothetical protein RHMOL_Rhmol08G0139600 [Rhododendron molle]|uniref:Uncharacterized protein n=1 Tax=Rhododendron molle TaxID=49168 RepID=A0ACC0MN46_RHOML|nr:hypothetical protein RHMOL_Rhmol08G0139600 [Rhododendron molle]